MPKYEHAHPGTLTVNHRGERFQIPEGKSVDSSELSDNILDWIPTAISKGVLVEVDDPEPEEVEAAQGEDNSEGDDKDDKKDEDNEDDEKDETNYWERFTEDARKFNMNDLRALRDKMKEVDPRMGGAANTSKEGLASEMLLIREEIASSGSETLEGIDNLLAQFFNPSDQD